MDRRGRSSFADRVLALLIVAVVGRASAQDLPTVPVETMPVRVGPGALLVAGELRDRHSEWSIVELAADTEAKVIARDVGALTVQRRVDLRHIVVTATAEQGSGWRGDGLFVVDLQKGKWSRIGAATAEVAGVVGGEVIVLDEGRLLRVPWSDPRRSPTMVCEAMFDRVFAVAGDRVIALREDKTQCCVVDLRTGGMRGVALPTGLTGAQAMVLDAAVSADGRRIGLAALNGACCVIDLESLLVVWTEPPGAGVQWIINPVGDVIPRLLQWDGEDLLVVVTGTRKIRRRDRNGDARDSVELDPTLPLSSSWLRPTARLTSMFFEDSEAVGLFEIKQGDLRYRGENAVLVRTRGATRSAGLLITPEGRFAVATPGDGALRTVVVDAVKKTQRVVAEKTFVSLQWIAPVE